MRTYEVSIYHPFDAEYTVEAESAQAAIVSLINVAWDGTKGELWRGGFCGVREVGDVAWSMYEVDVIYSPRFCGVEDE